MRKAIKQFKFYSFVLITLIHLQIIGMDQQKKRASDKTKSIPINVTVNVNNTSNSTSNSAAEAENKTNVENTVENENKNENKNESKNIFTVFFDKISDIPVRKYGNLFTSYIGNNRYKLIGISLVSIYLYFVYKIIKGNNYLGRKDSWALWKHDFSLTQLLEIPQEKLSRELILEIQRRYTSVEKPLDFISSLIAFMRDIDQEIAYTKHFINLEAWIRTLHISLFFPINKKRFSQASDRLGRLVYIRSLFLIWAANYKMDQSSRIPLITSM